MAETSAFGAGPGRTTGYGCGYGIPIIFIFDKLRPLYKKARKKYAEITAIATEFIQGVEVLKAFGRTAYAADRLEAASKEKRDVEIKASLLEFTTMGFTNCLAGPMFIVLIIRIVAPRIFAGALTVGTLLVFIELGMRMIEPLYAIGENIRGIQQARVALNRVFGIMALATERRIQESMAELLKGLNRIYDTFQKNQQAISAINSRLEMSFSGVRIIKAYACEEKYRRFFKEVLETRCNTELGVTRLEAVLHLIYQYIDYIAQAGIFFAGGIMAVRGELIIGTFYAFYTYLSMLIYPILDIPQLFVSGKRAFVNIDRLEEMANHPEPETR